MPASRARRAELGSKAQGNEHPHPPIRAPDAPKGGGLEGWRRRPRQNEGARAKGLAGDALANAEDAGDEDREDDKRPPPPIHWRPTRLTRPGLLTRTNGNFRLCSWGTSWEGPQPTRQPRPLRLGMGGWLRRGSPRGDMSVASWLSERGPRTRALASGCSAHFLGGARMDAASRRCCGQSAARWSAFGGAGVGRARLSPV